MTAPRACRAAAGALAFCLLPAMAEAQQVKAAPTHPAEPPAVQRASAVITQADFTQRLQVLSHDSMRGRLTGTPGLQSAARYVETQLRALGLKPAGEAGGFLQRYALPHYRVDLAGTSLSLGGRSLAANDFGLFPSQKEAVQAELLYAGPLPDTVVALPATAAGKLVAYSLAGQPDRSWDRRLERAVQVVGDVGGAGIVVLLDSMVARRMIAGTRPALERERTDMPERPRIALSSATAAEAFAAAGLKLDSLRQALTGHVAPVATGITVTLRQPLIVRADSVPNVVALLPGSDRALRDEYVVVSAHMDHVGVGRPDQHGDSIYNGADDNASGTTALLEIARAFRALPKAPARSVVFLAVSGEEQGLRGSEYWVKHATVPFERVVADLNLDMVTRNAPDTIAVLGEELSSLGPAVREIAAAHPELKLTVQKGSPSPELPLIRMSDQYPFLRAGVPSVFFNSGMHGDLHRPTDEIARCDTDKGARVARLAFLLAHAAARTPERPAWSEDGKREYLQKTP